MIPHRLRFAVLLALLASAARAGDLAIMAGDEPLKSKINEARDSVRLLFIGSPT